MMKPYKIKGQLYINNVVTVSDGGSKGFSGYDAIGQNISLFLPQYFLEDNFTGDAIPGR